jgi:hypothetical protein
VQTIQTDQKADIKPIKPPLAAPVTFRELLPWIALGLLLVAIAALVYFYFKMKRQNKPLVVSRLKTTIPPSEAALEARGLRRKLAVGRVRILFEMTDIVQNTSSVPVRAIDDNE